MPPKGKLPPLSQRRLGFQLPNLRHIAVKKVAEGDGWVLISKPSGLLSVPGKDPEHDDCALARVQAMYPNATGGMVVHRLDLPTSGLLLFALTPDRLIELNQQFAHRQVDKSYTAILERSPSVNHEDIFLPLRLDPFQRPLQMYDPLHGKPCHTRWCLLDPDHALGVKVKLIPITGRTHQLRVHTAHPLGLNAPIVGDPHYSSDAQADGSAPRGMRLHLHASFLSFTDPVSGHRVSYQDEAPF